MSTLTLPVLDASPRAASHAAIVVDDATVIFPGGVRALDGVNLRIAEATHTVLLGSSGSGKTTLLACIAGRRELTQGTIRTGGRVATIHQDLRLVKERSSLQNVLDGAAARLGTFATLVKYPPVEIARAIKLLEQVGLSHRVHARVSRLSGGEQQRVAIARALMNEPAILLADEPVAALDTVNAHHVMQILTDLCRQHGVTLVSVLHDAALAETYGDRLVGLANGHVEYDKTCKGHCPTSFHPSPGTPGEGRVRVLSDREPTNGSLETLNGDGHATFELNSSLNQNPHPALSRSTGRGTSCTVHAIEACDACRVPSTHPSLPVNVDDRPSIVRWSLAILAVLGVYALAVAYLPIKSRDFEGVWDNFARFGGRLIPTSQQWNAMDWTQIGWAILETLQLALLGTTLAVVVSLPLGALAARSVSPWWILAPARFVLNAIRAIPSLIWALLFVAIIGLGPLPGLLALAAYSMGYLTKFFYEAFETVDPKIPAALGELGMNAPARFRRSIWPAARTMVLSSCIFMLEYNVRTASVLGVVDAGGIGTYLRDHLTYGNYHVVGVLLAVLVALVLILDLVSTRLRRRLVGQ